MINFAHYILIKDAQVQTRLRKALFNSNIVGGIWILFAITSLLFDDFVPNETASSIMAMLSMLGLVVYFVFIAFFHINLSKAIKAQNGTLNPEDKIDRAVIKLNEIYATSLKKTKKWIFAVSGIIVLSIIGIFVGAFLDAGDAVYFICGVSISLPVIIFIIRNTISTSKINKDGMAEIEILMERAMQIKGLSAEKINKKKNSPFNQVQANKTIKYLYPDDGIRRKILKSAFFTILPGGIAGGFFGAGIVVASENGSIGLLIASIIAIFAVIGLSTAFTVFYQKRLRFAQRDIFLSDAERYKHHIELFDITTEYQRKSNKITLIGLSIIFATLIALLIIFGKKSFGALTGISIGALFAIIVFSTVATMSTYPKYRKKAKVIESQIDEHLKAYEVVFDEIQQPTTLESTTDSTAKNAEIITENAENTVEIAPENTTESTAENAESTAENTTESTAENAENTAESTTESTVE